MLLRLVRLRKFLQTVFTRAVFAAALAGICVSCRPTIMGTEAVTLSGSTTETPTATSLPTGVSISIGTPSTTVISSASVVDIPIAYSNASIVQLSPSLIDVSPIEGDVACGSVAVLTTAFNARTIRIGQCVGDGTVSVTIAPGSAVGTNGVVDTSGAKTEVFTVKATQPAIAIGRKSGQSATTSTLPLQFSVTFSGVIDPTTFTSADVVNEGTADVRAWSIVDSGDHQRFTLRTSDVVGSGTVVPKVIADSVSDEYGNLNTVSTATTTAARTVTYTESYAELNFATPETVVDDGAGRNVVSLAVNLSAVKSYDVVFSYSVNTVFSPGMDIGDYDLSTHVGIIPAGQLTTNLDFTFDGDSIAQPGGPRILQFNLGGTTNSNVVRPGSIPSHRYIVRDDDGGDDPMVKIATGDSHTCAITQAGKLYCWGENTAGQIGDGTYIHRSYPVEIDAGTQYAQVSCGSSSTCAITTAGALKCWGFNDAGQVGVNSVVTTNVTHLPSLVDSGVTYIAISVGYRAACGITSAHLLKCWGQNDKGEMADGTTVNTRYVPVATDAATAYAKVAVGQGNVCAITTGGVLKCWGAGTVDSIRSGMVGDGTAIQRLAPVEIDSGTLYAEVARGDYHACGITTAGVLKCWGANYGGQLGDATTTLRLSPVTVDAGTQYSELELGSGNTCAITTAGVLKCWGYEHHGEFGDQLYERSVSTPKVVDAGVNYAQIAMGAHYLCGITTAGDTKCWGHNSYGQLGAGMAAYLTSPSVVDAGTSYAKVATYAAHACGVTTAGVLKCWGSSHFAENGDGTAASNYGGLGGLIRAVPIIIDPGTIYSDIATGLYHGCGILASGKVKCWGYPDAAGMGTGNSSAIPALVNSTQTFTQVDASMHLTCAISVSSKLYCWGQNANNQLGLNVDPSVKKRSPTVVDSAVSYTHVTTGWNHGCALTSVGKVRCWGLNDNGFLGDGTTTNQTVPVDIDPTETYTLISTGAATTCGITSAGIRKCWGSNSKLQFGNGISTDSTTPVVAEAGTQYQALSMSGEFGCGITTDGVLKCWGTNTYGRLGDGTLTSRASPVVIDGGTTYSAIAVASDSACGITNAGVLKCWGANYWGQNGDGSHAATVNGGLIW